MFPPSRLFGLVCLLCLATWSTNATAAEEVYFARDVLAVLSKADCNAGACHGNLNGKGGLSLSLRGQDPRQDYDQLARTLAARRVNRVAPARSLILLKATAELPHEGGQRFAVDSPEYQILHDWIAAGLPGPEKSPAALVELTVAPTDAVVFAPTAEVQLTATARFADGTTRDVSRLAVYEPTDHRVEISPAGRVTPLATGVTTVIVRYLAEQTPVRLAFLPAREDFSWSAPPANNYVDELLYARMQQLQINPAPLAADHVFLRRASLDLLGLLPTADEARAFVADTSPDKRERLVDALLARPEFAETWALKWSDLVRNEEKVLDRRGVKALHGWMRDSFAEGKPLDRFVYELLAARGSTYENPPANYWRALREPLVRAEATAQVFLGYRLQCAKCHNHPFDHWTQDEYYNWAAVFAPIDYKIVENKRNDKFDKHEFVGEQIVQISDQGDVKNARTGQPAPPHYLDGATPGESDPLESLATWLTADNRQFARAQANRIWYHLMGRGLVDPVDDFRLTNPASHPELLERLTDELIASQFDLRQLVRAIVLSRSYQLASSTGAAQSSDETALAEQTYAQALVRRLSAEQLLDAQSQVLDVPAKFRDYPEGTRAGQIAGVQRIARDGKAPEGDLFLRLFGKPDRLLSCECERTNEPTLGHALSLIGGDQLHERLKQQGNRIDQLLLSNQERERMVESLFWTALSRPPTPREAEAALAALNDAESLRQGLEDVTWALLNAKELVFRH